MTVETETTKVTANGNDTATVFSFSPIVIFASTDLQVTHVDSDGVETVLSEGTGTSNYSVSVSEFPGTGSITYPATGSTRLATGESLVMKRVLTLSQGTDLQNQGGYFPETLEQQLDRLAMYSLQQQEVIDRSLTLRIGVTGVSVELPTPVGDRLIGWNSDADALANFAAAGDLEVSPFIETVLDDTTASAARTTLGAGTLDNLIGDATPQLGGDLDVNGNSIVSTSDGDIVLSPDGTGIVKSGSDPVKVAGKETVWVPATSMSPTTSNGCASLTTVETTAGRPDLEFLGFDASADEHAQFSVAFPKSWNASTVTFQVFWTSTATDTDGVTWALQGVAVADGDTIDAAYGTAVTVDDANQSTAEDLYVTAESGAVTIAGSPGDDELVYFRIFRDVSDANDTATEDARLIGIRLFFTTNAGSDA